MNDVKCLSFRPLDGESFSKPYPCKPCKFHGLRGTFRAKNLTSTFLPLNQVKNSSHTPKSTILSHRGKMGFSSNALVSITQKRAFANTLFCDKFYKTKKMRASCPPIFLLLPIFTYSQTQLTQKSDHRPLPFSLHLTLIFHVFLKRQYNHTFGR